jgi:hypothetical protein
VPIRGVRHRVAAPRLAGDEGERPAVREEPTFGEAVVGRVVVTPRRARQENDWRPHGGLPAASRRRCRLSS